ncbi:MAG: cytochrome ubiquinol oxidase subunit I [Nitrospira sp.]
MTAAVVTASCAVAAVGAYYLLSGQFLPYAKTFLQTGVVVGSNRVGSDDFPHRTRECQASLRLSTCQGSGVRRVVHDGARRRLDLMGQPNVETMTIDNPIEIPGALSFLVYKDLYAKVKGLDAFPRDQWPDNLPLLYYAYHVMAGLGTILVVTFGLALLSLWRGRLYKMKWLLWLLMLAVGDSPTLPRRPAG